MLGRFQLSEPSSLTIDGGSGVATTAAAETVTTRTITQKMLQHKQFLPIYSMRQQFLETVRTNQVVIVKGETGSGKSTQLTQYLFEGGYGTCGKIGCTQPRRIAAKSLAERVAEEMGTSVGKEVGYKIRFDYQAALDTTIIYMTDGILLHELAGDPNIRSYSAIILDEAHERLLHTDMLLGLLKSVGKRRKDLKIIITSATMDCTAFSKYFGNAVIFEIPGRTFPVEICFAVHPVQDHINSCLATIRSIHSQEKPGDILVFLPGQVEIELLCDKVTDADVLQELCVLPCYAALPMEDQNKVFEPVPPGKKRKVVIATNIAETSLTIDGIVYVVDSGIMKESQYDPKKRLTTLVTKPITQAQAIQRCGRAGRTQPGKAIRLYSKANFEKMLKAPVPEIQRCNLESNILLLAAHGVENIYRFDFMDPPPREAIQTALLELEDLQALDSRGRLTAVGRQMTRFPLEPRLSKMLIKSVELHCTDAMLTIVSMLSVQSSTGKIFFRPRKREHQADSAKVRFFKPEGDYATLLNVFNQWMSNNQSESWCHRHFINGKALQESVNIRSQLKAIMEANDFRQSDQFHIRDPNAIQKAIVSGYFSQVACKTPVGYGYRTYSNPQEFAFIHPGSSLFQNAPKWVIYEELKNTGKKPNLISVVAIEREWIACYAPSFHRRLMEVLPDAVVGNQALLDFPLQLF